MAAPAEFYLSELSHDPVLQKKVDVALKAEKSKESKNNRIECHGCGKKGVNQYECETSSCIEEMKQKKAANGKGGPKGKITDPAPKGNEPDIKIISGRIYLWCPKCNC